MSLNLVNPLSDGYFFSAHGAGGNPVDVPSKLVLKNPLKYRLTHKNANNIITIRGKQTLSGGDTRINTTTFNTIFQCPFPRFDAVRLIYGNVETGSATFTVKSVVGASNDVGIGGVSSSKKWTLPINNTTITNDGATGWQAVTYAGGSSSGTVPAMGADTSQPGLLFSDWIYLSSMTPINGARRPFLITQTIVPSSTGTGFTNFNHKTDNRNKSFDTSIYRETYVYTGDSVTANTGTFSGGSNQAVSPVIGVEFMVSTQVIRVLCVGDSITQGLDNTNSSSNSWCDYASWVQYANDYCLDNGMPINFINCGFSGATTTQIHDFGKLAIDAHLPDVVFYPPFSPNDVNENSAQIPTQVLIDQQWRRALNFANYALSKGVLPVFTFLAPKDYSATDDAFRIQLKNRAINCGFAVCDMTQASGDGGTPERYKTGFNSDATHPNVTGYQNMSLVAISTVDDLAVRNTRW